MKKTLRQLIDEHNNDYGFEVKNAVNSNYESLPPLSIVIPYWENKSTIGLLLKHLYNSIKEVKLNDKEWQYEVLIIDDHSTKHPAQKCIDHNQYNNLKIITNKKNEGRVYTRNTGLYNSKYELTLFLDADIFIDNTLILNHLKTHQYAQKQNKEIITVGFFSFQTDLDLFQKIDKIEAKDIELNDFRVKCTYGKTWIGCEEDKEFIGKKFQILEQTEMFKKWPNGLFGPWLLTNMVLGGFFIVNTKLSKKVNGFDKRFIGYGFTETSLPTKLIAKYNNYLVPVPHMGGIHIDDPTVCLSRSKKDKIFREKHDYYFNKYLKLS